jgi:hypothetical protein
VDEGGGLGLGLGWGFSGGAPPFALSAFLSTFRSFVTALPWLGDDFAGSCSVYEE